MALLLASTFATSVGAQETGTKGEGSGPAASRIDPKAYAAFATAITARLRGDDSFALKQLKTALKYAPKSTTVLREIAEIYGDRGDLIKAKEYFLKVLEQDARDIRANRELGRIYFRQKMPEEAIRHLRIAAQEEPEEFLARFVLATLYRMTDRLEECAGEYEAVLRMRPHLVDTSETLMEIYHERSRDIESLRREVQGSPQEDFIPYFRLAQAYLDSQMPQEAIQALQTAVIIEPRWCAGHETLGKLYEQSHDLPRAIEAYSQAAPNHPNRVDLLFRVGGLYLQLNRLADAARELEKVRAIQPKHEQALYRLTYCYHELRQLDQAIAAGEEYVQHCGGEPDPSIYELLGTAYVASGRPGKASQYASSLRQILEKTPPTARYASTARLAANVLSALNDRKAAIQVLEQALGISPDHLEAHLDLAVLYDLEGLDKEAEGALRRVLEQDPADARANNHLGYFLAERGRSLEEALTRIQNALKAEPRNWAYLDSLGWVYFKLDRIQDALEKLEEAIIIHEDPILREHLGDVLQAAGHPQKALEQWSKALELHPGLERVLQKMRAVPKLAQ